MSQPATQAAQSSVGDTVHSDMDWFQRHLRSENKSPTTIETHLTRLAECLLPKRTVRAPASPSTGSVAVTTRGVS
jgi:hypothetical protein